MAFFLLTSRSLVRCSIDTLTQRGALSECFLVSYLPTCARLARSVAGAQLAGDGHCRPNVSSEGTWIAVEGVEVRGSGEERREERLREREEQVVPVEVGQ